MHPRWQFAQRLIDGGTFPLLRDSVETLQVNLGKRCNQACLHCHVEAGPNRTENMTRATAERIMTLLAASPKTRVLDITGGAPELNENFQWMVRRARELDRDVIDRCNLTVFFEPGTHSLPAFLAEHSVHVVASLPCYSEFNVDAQRGKGAFEKSIAGLRLLNELGYGQADGNLQLSLVYNPGGAFLPPSQATLEAEYRAQLSEDHGIQFTRLFTLTNLPINRFESSLRKRGELESYMDLLVDNFNPATVPELMCRSQLSIGYDGKIYDCDFNQMLEMPARASELRAPAHVD